MDDAGAKTRVRDIKKGKSMRRFFACDLDRSGAFWEFIMGKI